MNTTNNFYRERVRKGLSAEEAAAGIGVALPELRKWEAGCTEPFASQLVEICRFYGCSPDYLLGLSDQRMAGLVRER